MPGALHATTQELKIESIELLNVRGTIVVRSRTTDGVEGMSCTTPRIEYLHPILTQRVVPYFIGKDARELPQLVRGIHRFLSNYKLTGLPFWSCVAWVEFSLIDLIGRAANRTASEILGTVRRTHVPVYLSLIDRESAPGDVVMKIGERLASTGAMAVKVKIGGRMSANADAVPGRTEELLETLRRELPAETTIYVDANGSYDAAKAVEVGRMLEEFGVGFFEEPCPFEHYEETRRVAEALTIPIAGGEQDSSVYRWEEMLSRRVVDIPQPDLIYNGGFLRTAELAAKAEALGYRISLHNPPRGPAAHYMVHMAALLSNPANHHELNVDYRAESWHEPHLEVSGGTLAVPPGPGLGLEIDPSALRKARTVTRVRNLARKVFGFRSG